MPTSDVRTVTEAPLMSPPLPDDHRYLSRGVSGGWWVWEGGRGKPVASPQRARGRNSFPRSAQVPSSIPMYFWMT